jgi:hypothetical protein
MNMFAQINLVDNGVIPQITDDRRIHTSQVKEN